jgi:hypothetical protein
VDEPAFAEASTSAKATVDEPAFAEAPADQTADQIADPTADNQSSKPWRTDVEALKAEFLEALAETPEPDSVQAATASRTSRVRSQKPTAKKTADVSLRKETASKPVASPAAQLTPVVAEALKPVVATPQKPVVADIVKPAASVTTKPIDPPDITELLRSIDASSAPLDIEAARSDEERMFEPDPKKTRTGGSRWRRLAVLLLVLFAIGEGGVIAQRVFRKPTGPTNGMLSVQTTPPGVAIFVDGESRGNTPARISVSAGSHILELRGRGVPRVIPVSVTAGAEVSQYLELPETPAAGSLLVQSDPPGARVTVDGVAHGIAPVSVADLAPGDHEVVLQAQGGAPVRQRVVIQAGVTSSVLAPVAAVQGPVSGWLSVKAPVTMEIKEGGRLLGTTDSDRLMMSAGRHEVELVNDTLGYRATKIVQIAPGKVAPLAIELPQGTIHLNALPWAEVWIDGRRVGETPIGNLAVTIGPHEILFRHPQFGERKQAVSVTMNAPVRLSVDMK